MESKELVRIWVKRKCSDGHIEQGTCNIYFKTVAEAKKCVSYLNANEENPNVKYFYQKQIITEYNSAEEYVTEHELPKEL